MQKAASAGTATAHLATVFGARCGIFSIGLQPAALAYVYLELRTGAPDWHDLHLQEKLADANEVIGDYFRRKRESGSSGSAIFKQWRSHG